VKKVLLVSNTVMHYRVSVYNYFADNFRKDGWELSVITNKLQSTNMHPLRFTLKEIPLTFKSISREIKEIAPDAVIVFLHLKDLAIWPVVHWLKIRRIPFAFWTKGANLDDADNPVRSLMFKYIHTISNRLILYSANELKYVGKHNLRKVFVANNTINYHEFAKVTQSKEEIKKEFGIPFSRVVLFTGRIGIDGDRKKVSHLIDVFKNIPFADAGAVIVGSGLSDELRREMNPKNTIYLGEVHDPENVKISKLFAMADIFCIPGHVGLGLNQAMYWGLPTVTEEGKQPPEFHYLVDGRNGYVVKEDDVEALRNRIYTLLENKNLCQEFGRNAREDLLRVASIEGMYNAFHSCIESMGDSNLLPVVEGQTSK